jgi:inosine-uridine nucleoside N-ribohydrolase
MTWQIANITNIPVYKGATFPLINTAARSTAWQMAFGSLAWNG